MISGTYQCCYTNATIDKGGVQASGWQAVAVSPDIPEEAFSFCLKLQERNSNIQKTMRDEQGQVLKLFEISGDGKYLYISKTRYGLQDRVGRPNMFAHTYILPCKDAEFISDPNHFLTLADENFKGSPEEAEMPAEALLRLPSIDLEEAIQGCRLTDDLYGTMIRAVYLQCSEKKNADPLFIQYDGTEKHMLNLLFCIYSALPLSLRKTLSFASCETDNTRGAQLIFSINATERSRFLNPETGENNVLTERVERLLSQLGFVDYTARQHVTLDEPEYYSKLEAKAGELGDLSASNELILKIAHWMLTDQKVGDFDDTGLVLSLSDALRTGTGSSPLMGRHIAGLLDEVTKRKIGLSEANEGMLAARLGKDAVPELEAAADRYYLSRFGSLPKEEAAAKLANMQPEEQKSYLTKLETLPEGLDILEQYYGEFVLKKQGKNWDDLQSVLEETTNLRVLRESMGDRIEAAAWDLYCTGIETVKPEEALERHRQYMEVMKHLVPESGLERCAESAKETFWNTVTPLNIDFSAVKSYESLRGPENTKTEVLLQYLELPQLLRDKGEVRFLAGSFDYFQRNRDFFDSATLSAAKERLINEANKISVGADEDTGKWRGLVLAMPARELAEKLFSVWANLKKGDVETSFRGYQAIMERLSLAEGRENQKKDLTERMTCGLERLDKKGSAVSLDKWLILGNEAYGNGFRLFDHVKSSILQKEAEEVVRDSELMAEAATQQQAEEYLSGKGEEAKQVKRWLAAEKQRKKQDDAQKKAEEKAKAKEDEALKSKAAASGKTSAIQTKPAGTSRLKEKEENKMGFLAWLRGKK